MGVEVVGQGMMMAGIAGRVRFTPGMSLGIGRRVGVAMVGGVRVMTVCGRRLMGRRLAMSHMQVMDMREKLVQVGHGQDQYHAQPQEAPGFSFGRIHESET